MENLTLLALSSASKALRGERVLAGAGIPCALVPVPRHLSAHCGVALRVDVSHREAARAALEAAGIAVSATYDLSRREGGDEAGRSNCADQGGIT
jgi:hypothetical protein